MWTTKCKESFQNLKQLLTTTPILRIADPDGDFVVCTYARKEGLGGVLMQNDCVTYYESRNLKERKQNYPTADLDLAAIICTLKMWRNYLMGKTFLLKTDNMSLKYLIEQENLNSMKARWLAFLSERYFELKHIKCKENKIVNSLS